MKKVVEKFLTVSECKHIINLYESAQDEMWENKDHQYRFYFIDLLRSKRYDYKKDLGTDKFDRFNFRSLRIQMVDETIDQVARFHTHNPKEWFFVVFLNKSFENGNLIFGDQTIVKPQTGTLVYANGHELHLVQNCKGKRYTLVGFFDNDAFNVQKENKQII